MQQAQNTFAGLAETVRSTINQQVAPVEDKPHGTMRSSTQSERLN